MKKILWLPSWYPSKLDRFTGDFVQRHAQALALYRPLVVLYLVKDVEGMVTKNVTIEIADINGVREMIVYYKPRATGWEWVDKILSVTKYISVYTSQLKKLFSSEHAAGYLHVHVPMKAGVLALWCKRRYKVPFIVTEHWAAYNQLNPDNFFAKGWLFRWLSKKIFESASVVTTVCEANRKELLSLFNIRQSAVINNVANGQLFHYQPRTGSTGFGFVHVSTLHKQKNIKGLLNAMQLLKNMRTDWHCTIVGPYKAFMQDMATELGLQHHISWTGEIPYDQVANVVKGADCMVMFSKYENSPCSIIEALMAGIPVVSTNVGGIPELINKSNGLLVPSGDEAALAHAMNALIDSKGRYNNAAIANAAKARFSYSVIGARLAELYR